MQRSTFSQKNTVYIYTLNYFLSDFYITHSISILYIYYYIIILLYYYIIVLLYYFCTIFIYSRFFNKTLSNNCIE